MRKIALVPLAGLSAAAVALTACGAERLEPKLELRDAASNLGEEEALTMTISLEGDAASVRDLAASLGEDPSSVDDATLEKILNSSLSLGYDRNGESEEDDASYLALNYDGLDVAEVRFVEESLYVRADLPGLLEKEPALAPGADLSGVEAELEAALPGSGGLVNGEWVGADLAPLLDMAQEEAPDSETVQQVQEELMQAAENLLGSAEIVRDEDDPDHLIVTTSTREAAAELSRITETLSEVSGAPLAPEDVAPLSDVEDRPIVIDVYLADEKLEALELNLSQFSDTTTERLALRVEVEAGAQIEAPEAEMVDIEPLLATFEGIVSGAEESTTTAELEATARDALALAAFDSDTVTLEHLQMAGETYDLTLVDGAEKDAGAGELGYVLNENGFALAQTSPSGKVCTTITQTKERGFGAMPESSCNEPGSEPQLRTVLESGMLD